MALRRDPFSPGERAKADEYTLARLRFRRWEEPWGDLLVVLALLSGLLPWWEATLAVWLPGTALRGAVFLLTLLLAFDLLQLPFGVYETFGIEGRFGYNRTTWKTWVADQARSLWVGLVLGIPLLGGLLLFMTRAGPAWWLAAFLFVALFQVALLFLFPVFIAPFFNRFRALEAGEVADRVRALCVRLDFPVRGVMVMDGSRRSLHANAYFAGLGRSRRAVLYDTLLARLSPPQVEAVLAHEIGHRRRHHLARGLLLGLVFLFAGLWSLSLFPGWEAPLRALGFSGAAAGLPHVSLLLFAMLAGPVVFLFSPLMKMFSRKWEFEADAFAARHCGPEAMRSALVALAAGERMDLAPDPLYAAWHYSHPPVGERVAALESAV